MVDDARLTVLCVDDEPHNLVAFRYALEDRFEILTAGSGGEALGILASREIDVLVADQRMPGMTGVDLCERARELRPACVRVILTAYADVAAAEAAINRGQVSRFLRKPWDTAAIAQALVDAVAEAHGRTVGRPGSGRVEADWSRAVALARVEVAHQVRGPVGVLATRLADAIELLSGLLLATGEGSEDERPLQRVLHALADVAASVERLDALCSRIERDAGIEAPPESAVCGMCGESAGARPRAHLSAERLDGRPETQ